MVTYDIENFYIVAALHDLMHLKRWSVTDVPPALRRTFTFIVVGLITKNKPLLIHNIIKHKLYVLYVGSFHIAIQWVSILPIISAPVVTVQHCHHHHYMQFCNISIIYCNCILFLVESLATLVSGFHYFFCVH